MKTMSTEMRDMARYMRYMRNLSMGAEDMDRYMRSMERYMRDMEDAEDDDEVMEHLGSIEGILSEMRGGLSEMEDADEMEKAMKGMERAMKAMKGNAPSHDYSKKDGEFSKLATRTENRHHFFEADDNGDDDDDDDDDDNGDDSDDDKKEESVQEYIADLEEQNRILREHNDQLRSTLRTTGAAYVMATNSFGLSESAVPEFMNVVNERDVDDFERLADFEEYVEGVRAEFMEEGGPESTPDPLSLLGESRELSLTDGPLFGNIKRLSGAGH